MFFFFFKLLLFCAMMWLAMSVASALVDIMVVVSHLSLLRFQINPVATL